MAATFGQFPANFRFSGALVTYVFFTATFAEQWTQYKVEMGNCCEGRRWGRRRTYKKEVNLLP